MKRTGIVVLAMIVGGAMGALAADTYVVDAAHSSVGFAVKHMMVSNVRGVFTDVKGTATADPNDLGKSGVQVEIAAASISTSNSDRDTHLRSANFFDVARYPTITFKSTRVERKGDGYLATGLLTMKGVSKELALPFTVTGPVLPLFDRSHITPPELDAEITLSADNPERFSVLPILLSAELLAPNMEYVL